MVVEWPSGHIFLERKICVSGSKSAIAITVEYRLAPEHPYPAGLDDCYAGLKWIGNNLDTLGIDPERLMIAGQSAGGVLREGTTYIVYKLTFYCKKQLNIINPFINHNIIAINL